VRLSLGGSRLRLVRQLLVEGLALAFLASILGLSIAWTLPDYVVTRMSHSAVTGIRPDWSVLLYAAGLAVLACVAFGLAPALHATRGNIATALKDEARLQGTRMTLRGVLLSVQVALSVVLLAGAGLLTRAVQHAGNLDLGFRIDGLTVLSIELPASDYAGPRSGEFARQLVGAIDGAALCSQEPLSNSTQMRSLRLPGEPEKANRGVIFHSITPLYFPLLEIPLVAGRNFMPADAGRPVAIVNQAMAKRYWPGESALGKTVISDGALEIIGVARDASTQGLQGGHEILYVPLAGGGVPKILVWGVGPEAVEPAAAIVKRLEPRAVVESKRLRENFDRAMEPAIASAMLAGMVGLVALALATIGISGVFAYVVRQRTREIGIRMALGARPADAMRLVLGSSGRSLAAGVVTGLAGAAAVSKLLESQFVGVRALDFVAYAGVVSILVAAGALASAAPARRAARVDPVRALRWE
jgi:predicted permease